MQFVDMIPAVNHPSYQRDHLLLSLECCYHAFAPLSEQHVKSLEPQASDMKSFPDLSSDHVQHNIYNQCGFPVRKSNFVSSYDIIVWAKFDEE
jgi:hypothetical protein